MIPIILTHYSTAASHSIIRPDVYRVDPEMENDVDGGDLTALRLLHMADGDVDDRHRRLLNRTESCLWGASSTISMEVAGQASRHDQVLRLGDGVFGLGRWNVDDGV